MDRYTVTYSVDVKASSLEDALEKAKKADPVDVLKPMRVTHVLRWTDTDPVPEVLI